MYKFIGSNFEYPLEAKRTNVSGRVFLKFVVEKDGTVSNIENIQSIGFGIDEEAIRVIKLMPKWEAAEYKGKKVRSEFTLPIYDLIRE